MAEKRFIDANALKVKALPDPDSGEGLVYVQDIDEAPTADVAPVVHGRWLLDGRCSECLENPLSTHKNYCPNCGAKMDLEMMDNGEK